MQQGKRLGRADSAARVLLTILAARGIAIADQIRARIAECADPDLLERWATRAATCSTIDEVFASGASEDRRAAGASKPAGNPKRAEPEIW